MSVYIYLNAILTLEKTEWAIKNGQSRDSGNIGYTRHRTKTNKAKNTNFVEDLPMIIPGQFGFNCPSGFREEAF
jgi:hypothetical protein